MAVMTGLDFKISEMAGRIRDMREIMGFSQEEMASRTGVPMEEYIACETGEHDMSFAFIYRCAMAFGVDVSDIIEGKSPKLRAYTVTRRGEGQQIREAHGMVYYNMAASFRNRVSEPLFVELKYDREAEHRAIPVTTHSGQEFDIVIRGTMKLQIGEHTEVLHEGDTAYYSSTIPHGMVALGGGDCEFYAIVLDPSGESEKNEEVRAAESEILPTQKRDEKDRIYRNYVDVTENENGTPTSITFKNTESFNFAFDIVDGIARRDPDKLAMLYVGKDLSEKRFTFNDMKRNSARCANYFKSLGIKKGDRVMLILKRHYQFWFAMLGLNKLGAIAILATNQLLEHDIEYRFKTAGVSTIICTADGDTAHQAELAAAKCPTVKNFLLVNGRREGWRSFDEEYTMFSTHFARTEESPRGDDPMLMFFTSGTTGYPKAAVHNHKYPLGHFHTAKYWHCVDPEGLHFTISDTGWAKSMWGKLYGQWLCEAATFVFDFDRFDAAEILPMFKKYNITTFCAPPTMLRMMVKQDISHYDLSSVKHMSTAGEALNPEVYRQFKKATGLRIMEGFGQTETTCIIGNLVGEKHKLGSMGKPCPIYNVQLLSPEGEPVPDGESGEIVVDVRNGAPCGLFTGYYENPEKTAEVWHDGFYHTGDVAWRDEDGYYWYVGRVDDVIKSSGYRIGPFEIESVIMELPYVLECGVSAAPDEVRGQVVKASIVLVKGTEGTEELKKEIQNYVKQHTAPYKYPRVVVFRDSLPKTTSGKIIRHQL